MQRLVRDGSLSMGHARALLGTPDRAFQEQLARRAANDGLTVRAVEEAIRARQGDAGVGRRRGAPRPSPTRQLRPPGLLELEELLGDHLDTRVTVSMTAKKGKVVIEFSDLEDLERIYKSVIGRE